jgi:ketosteroid isomerase-like protein
MKNNPSQFAGDWIESWNSHDMNRILSHYSEDCEVTTPMIKLVLGAETGTLAGKEAIRKYWDAAMKKIPDLKFELKEVAESMESIAICYKSNFGKMAIEVMFFNQNGKVNKAIVHYSALS